MSEELSFNTYADGDEIRVVGYVVGCHHFRADKNAIGLLRTHCLNAWIEIRGFGKLENRQGQHGEFILVINSGAEYCQPISTSRYLDMRDFAAQQN